MRFRKRYFVIGGLAALAILCSLLMLSMFPPRGAEQDCDTSRGGKSVAINGHIMWYDVYGKKKDKTPIYILAGGPGFSSEYIEPYIRFLAKSGPSFCLMEGVRADPNTQRICPTVHTKIMGRI